MTALGLEIKSERVLDGGTFSSSRKSNSFGPNYEVSQLSSGIHQEAWVKNNRKK